MKYESYEKKMARCHDEFDVYFARAKLDEELAKEQASTSERRGSLPDAQPAMLSVDVPGHHRRALSCKLPARKRSSAPLWTLLCNARRPRDTVAASLRGGTH